MSFQFKLFIQICLAALYIFMVSPFAYAQTSSASAVAGYWQTIDGKTKKPSSVIHFYSNGDLYFGKIVKTYPVPGTKKITFCAHCVGNQKNKPILGLTIIKNMQCEHSQCRHGTILDPRNGKVYHANMRLINGGQQVKVHGYIGIALFGKTVVWNRISKM